jgi:hypothetical protein
MPQEITIWGIGNLKKCEKMNHETGEKQIIKRCTGTVEFPILAEKAGIYEDTKVYLYTEEEHLIKQAEIPSLEEYLLNMMEYVKTALLNQQDFETELNKVLEYIRESQQKGG